MTDIDISKIKPGDYVTVRYQVHAKHAYIENARTIMVGADGVTEWFSWIEEGWIISHEPAPEPLKIGDVVWTDTDQHGTIVGLHDENAWIYVFKKVYVWRKLSELRRVDQP